MTARPASPAIAGSLMIVGAVIATAGGFAEWYEVLEGGERFHLSGADVTVGAGTIFFGVLTGIFAIVMVLRARKKGGRAWSITALVLASFLASSSLYVIANAADALIEFEASSLGEAWGISENEAKVVLEQELEAGILEVDAGPAAWIAIVGTVLVIAGAITGIARAKRFVRPVEPPIGVAPVIPPPPPMPPAP